MARTVPFDAIKSFGVDLPRELALLAGKLETKFKLDDNAEFGPFTITTPNTKDAIVNARPWDIVLVDPSPNGRKVLLPPPDDPKAGNSWIGIKNDSDATSTITIAPITGTIDGSAALSLTTSRAFQFVFSNGKEWKVGPSNIGTAADLEIRPTAFSTQQNNYSPTGWSTARYVLLTPTAACNITGFDANVAVRRKTLIHIGAENLPSGIPLGFLEESPSSTAANRIATPPPNDIYMLRHWSLDVWYDTTAARWRFV